MPGTPSIRSPFHATHVLSLETGVPPAIFCFCYPSQSREKCNALANRHADQSVYVDAQRPQLDLCLRNLAHQLLVRVGNIVESQHAPAEAEEEECAEGDEEPEGELEKVREHAGHRGYGADMDQVIVSDQRIEAGCDRGVQGRKASALSCATRMRHVARGRKADREGGMVSATYDWDYLGLHDGRQRNELEVESEVELADAQDVRRRRCALADAPPAMGQEKR